MNRKQLSIIVVLALVLGGLGLYLNRKKSASFERTEKSASEKLLGDFPVNDVTQIGLRQHTNEVTLVKAEVWTLKERHGYPANSDEIIEFARKLWNLRPAQSQRIGESQLGRLELLPPDKGGTNSGTLVEFKGKDGKLIRSLVLGKKSMRESSGGQFGGGSWPSGRWLYVPDKPGVAYLVSESFSEVEPKPDRWLKKDFFKVEKVKTVTVTQPVATNSWTLTREIENGEVKLVDAKEGEQLDTGKGSSAGNALSYPSFNDVVGPDAKPEETGLDSPVVAKLETFDGFGYTIKIGKKTGEDNHYLQMSVTGEFPKERTPGKDEKPEDKEKLDKEFKDKLAKLEEKLKTEKAFEKWTYVVSKWTVDPLLKERKELLIEKKAEEPKPDAPAAGAPATSAPPTPPPLPGFPAESTDPKAEEKPPTVEPKKPDAP